MLDSLVTQLKDLVSQRQLFKAFQTFFLIQIHRHSPSCDIICQSVSELLTPCIDLKLLLPGKQLHSHVISLGLQQDPVIARRLITFYSSHNLLLDAHIITENSCNSNPLPWNWLISGYVKNGLFCEAISAYNQMLGNGIQPDHFTYPLIFKSCAETHNLKFGAEVHKSIKNCKHRMDLFVQNALVSLYSKCGELGLARDVFDAILEKDAVSWNTMIAGYAGKGMWQNALDLFERIRSSTTLDLNTLHWKTIARCFFRIGHFIHALGILREGSAFGSLLEYPEIIICLGACSHMGFVKLVKEIHGYAICTGSANLSFVQNTLITTYSRFGDLSHARVVFRSMKKKDCVSWNCIISGYAHMGCSDESLNLLKKMLHSGIDPNEATLAGILPLCARVADLRHGKEFHCYIIRREVLADDLLVSNSLVDLYARSGEIKDAKKVFNSISDKTVVSFTTLIGGYGMLGEGKAALKLFEEMIRSDIKPDSIIFVAVLAACSHSRLVSEGEMVFRQMQEVYNMSPQIDHFAVMVDLFSRAGLLEKAKDILSRMPYAPTHTMWVALLASCKVYGNAKVGDWAVEKLLEAKPEHSGHLALMANVYGASKSWNKFAKVRSLQRELGVRRQPGRAWIDVGSGFESFVIDDRRNSQSPEIYESLVMLRKHMGGFGYVATEDFCSDEYVTKCL